MLREPTVNLGEYLNLDYLTVLYLSHMNLPSTTYIYTCTDIPTYLRTQIRTSRYVSRICIL